MCLRIYLSSPTVIGAGGEYQVNSTLARKLDASEYTLLNDLTLPTDQGTTQIDHIVLSRFGVYVIETKNMSGWIYGSASQARWTQVVGRKKYPFQNPLRQNYHHLKVVQALLGIRQDQLENLVVFVGTAEPKTNMPFNVFWSKQRLFAYISSRNIIQFSDTEVRDFAQKLRSTALENNNETRRAHLQNVQNKKTRRTITSPKCPKCGSQMVSRTNRKTGSSFLGCARYPKCRGTRQLN